MNQPIPRAEIERFTAQLAEKRRRMAKQEHSRRGYRDENDVWQGGLLSFVRYFWHVLEPGTPFTEGWILEAIVEHLEAVTFGEITNLLVNVPPGCCKSLLTNVYWPAWEWSAMELSHIRYVTFSYSASNTERDNQRFGDLVTSSEFQLMYPEVKIRQNGMTMVSNYKHGWKLASSVTGSATGKRGNRAICFPADQIVQTECGPLSIGEIVEHRMAIRVPSVDTKTGEVSLQPIAGWHRNPASEVVKILLSDGSSVRCTPNHRFWDGNKWVEASNLLPGTALPVVRKADSFGNIAPSATYADTLNSHALDAIASSENVSSVHDIAGYFARLLLGQELTSARFHKSTVGNGIINVLFSRSIFEIGRSAIQSIPVLVTNLLSFGAWTNECTGDQLVNSTQIGLAHLSKVESHISLRHCACHYFPRISHKVRSFLMANTVSVDGCSSSPMNHSRHASNSPHIGDLIAFKPDDRTPFLVVEGIEFDGHADCSYCLTVEQNHNFIVGLHQGLIASNCDDLNNVKESESKPVMEETNRWLRESLSSRLNNMETDAKIVIAQRVGEGDASGEILSLGLPYCHLCIAMEYVWSADENGQPYATQIGWIDPRWRPTPEECNGELAWHERFSENAVRALKKELGPYATAAQLQQTPEARGGGIFKREWWQVWDPPDGKFPPFSYIVASLDGAFTSKEENDPSALTLWGIFENEMGYNRAMLIHAWSKKLPFSGVKVDVLPGEYDSVYRRRAMPHWGLIEWVADTCNRFKADRLLIENKGPGISAAQSLSNSHGRAGWAIELAEPKGDKVARAIAVQPTFSQLMVYAPDREWADDTIDEMAVFPKGRHDDRVDSATQAIKHLRDNGILRSDEERRAEEIEAVTHKGKQMQKRPRYPGMRATG